MQWMPFLITLYFFNSSQSIAQTPVAYTLTDGDVMVVNGVITECSYDFAANSDGTILTIPSLLDGQTISGIIDGEEPFVQQFTGPFVEKNIVEVTLPNNIETLGENAFAKNNLNSIILPSSLKDIRRNAFFGNSLDSVFIPNSVLRIGQNCVHTNYGMKLELEDNSQLINIESHAFVNTGVDSITLPISIVPDDNFEYWVRFTSSGKVIVPGGTTISPSNHGFVAKFDYTLQDNEVVVDNGVLKSCTYSFIAKYISIPEQLDNQVVTSILDAADQTSGVFYAKGLLGVKLPNTLVKVGNFAFNLNGIDTLVIPSGLKRVGRYSFWRAGLDTVLYENPSSLEKIDLEAFNNNIGLKMVFSETIKAGFDFLHWKNTFGDTFDAGSSIPDFGSEYTAVFTPVVSVNELFNATVNCFPNPTNGQLSVSGENLKSIYLFDANGKLMLQSMPNANAKILNLSALPCGSYHLRVQNADGEFAHRKIQKN